MDNTRGIVLMIAAMAGFALEDMVIKILSRSLPTGEILILLGIGGALVFAGLARRKRLAFFSRDFLSPMVMLRNAGEVIGTIGFVLAVVLTPLSMASAIIQALPLFVTLGAALFFGEAVGWRRWSAIVLGFAGVLLIVRPGMEGFRPAALFAVLGVIGLGIRDLATRAVPHAISSIVLSVYGFAALIPAGALMMAAMGDPWRSPLPAEMLILACGVCVGGAGYYALTAANRVGEVAVVTPFRYTRLIFALIIGISFFGERPDAWTLGGAALIIGSGLYALWRERRLRARRPLSPGSAAV